MEKGQLCYIIINNDIEPVTFIEKYNPGKGHVKKLNNSKEDWVDLSCIYNTKEQAYKTLLKWLEEDKQDAEDWIEDAETELDLINATIKNLKQKYEI